VDSPKLGSTFANLAHLGYLALLNAGHSSVNKLNYAVLTDAKPNYCNGLFMQL
jgi:hypothetical protein